MNKAAEHVFLFDGGAVGFNGYVQLCRFLPTLRPTTIVSPKMNAFVRVACKLYDVVRRIPPRDKAFSYQEAYFKFRMNLRRGDHVAHFLSGDDHTPMLRSCAKRTARRGRLIFTLHQPFRLWRNERLNLLRKLNGIITMCESDATLFRDAVPGVPVKCIPHGIDTKHWTRGSWPESPVKKVGYCGKYLRNIPMFIRVAERILANRPDVEFRCLITPGGMSDKWTSFGLNPRVHIDFNLSADEVVQFYQKLDLLMMPLDDTTANNAIVEAMSCGVPVLSTNVGGIATYGGGTVFPVVSNNDDAALYQLLCRYLDNLGLRRRTGMACRLFAEEKLAWDYVAAQHAQFYDSTAIALTPNVLEARTHLTAAQ